MLATVLAAVLMPLAMLAVAFVFPTRVDPDGPALEDLEFEYRKWSIAGVPFFLVAICGCGAAWYFVLNASVGSTDVALPQLVVIRPAPAMAGLAAMALGFSCGTLITFLAYWVLLGDRFSEFCRYDQLANGYNTIRALAWLCVLGGAFGTVMALCAAGWSITFTPQEIVIDPALGSARGYKYGDVTQVTISTLFVAPNGDHVPRWNGVIDFRDGSRWGSRDSPDDLTKDEYERLFALVAERAEIEVTKAPVLRRDQL